MSTAFEVETRASQDVPAFAQAMADALADDRKFALWIESDAGTSAWPTQSGAYRLRDIVWI